MDQQTKLNKAFSLPLILEILNEATNRIHSAVSLEDTHKWSIFVFYTAVSYVISLRGNEGFLLDLEVLISHNNSKQPDHFIIALLGKLRVK